MSKIGYVTIGAIDGAKSGAFYDAVFGALGSERKLDGRRMDRLRRDRSRQEHHGLPHCDLSAS